MQDPWDSHLSKFIILQPIDFFGDECFYGQFKVMFFFELLLTEILSFIIDPIVEQRRPSFDIRRELFADVLRYESNKIMNTDA